MAQLPLCSFHSTDCEALDGKHCKALCSTRFKHRSVCPFYVEAKEAHARRAKAHMRLIRLKRYDLIEKYRRWD